MQKKLYLSLGLILPICVITLIYNFPETFSFEWDGSIMALIIAGALFGAGVIFAASKFFKSVTFKPKSFFLYFLLPYVLVHAAAYIWLILALRNLFSSNGF